MNPTPPTFGNALAVQHLFGTPVRDGGVTVIPVARFSGGGGGGAEGGFGGAMRPLGALVIEGGSARGGDPGRVYWRPVVDTTAVLTAVGVGFGCFALLRALARRHRTRRARCGACGHPREDDTERA